MVWHGGAPSHVRFAGRVGKPRRINAVRQRKKNLPDSSGLDRAMTLTIVLMGMARSSRAMTMKT
jgi:hypothetical protein